MRRPSLSGQLTIWALARAGALSARVLQLRDVARVALWPLETKEYDNWELWRRSLKLAWRGARDGANMRPVLGIMRRYDAVRREVVAGPPPPVDDLTKARRRKQGLCLDCGGLLVWTKGFSVRRCVRCPFEASR